MASVNDIPNKDQLYGRFEAGEERNRKRRDWKDELHKKVTSKSLDIALDDEDDMDIKTSKTITNNGLGLKELALVGALMAGTGVGGAGLTAFLLDKDAPAPVVQPVDHKDTDTLFDLQFTDPKND